MPVKSGKASIPQKYPLRALEMKLQGRVDLAFEMLPGDAVTQVTITRSSGHEIVDDAAVNAVRKCPFFFW